MKLFITHLWCKCLVIWWCKQRGSFISTTVHNTCFLKSRNIQDVDFLLRSQNNGYFRTNCTNNPILCRWELAFLSLQMRDIGMANLQKENAMKWMIGLINSIHCWKVWISSSRNTELPRTNWLSKFRKSCMRFVFCICNKHDYDIRSHPSIV